MDILIKILSTLVAIEFIFIMYLETFATTSKKTAETFNLTEEDFTNDKVKLLLKNQGVYNGLIGMVVLYATFFALNGNAMLVGSMIYIILVAIYGAYSSSNISIFFKQATLSVITLVLLLLF
ncbi:DUF1304 family protein [Periweissella fabaria]|uniref:DUF1304 domain-containing protein n=1 Tax=Periweissella fabaria TaxID=546157 RepID=A0ABN8BKU9_9LACO|nr:DUF1304 family protein [Periweissella fabaria]MCM0597717.1 DUF1304 family protein [Periweissella fabaria]CAH0417166.1 hypothetical protein WFA24289_01495 [Periweissella fabaria]